MKFKLWMILPYVMFAWMTLVLSIVFADFIPALLITGTATGLFTFWIIRKDNKKTEIKSAL